MTRRITTEQFLAMQKNPKKRSDLDVFSRLPKAKARSKYGNVKVQIDGFTFDSKAEARRYDELKMRVSTGGISSLVVHPGWDLGSCYYKADFSYVVNESLGVVEDVKGRETKDFKIKLKLMREKYGIEVRLLTKESDSRLFR